MKIQTRKTIQKARKVNMAQLSVFYETGSLRATNPELEGLKIIVLAPIEWQDAQEIVASIIATIFQDPALQYYGFKYLPQATETNHHIYEED